MNPLLTDSRRQALRSASHWYAVLSGERVSPQQEARWQQWYEQDQDNQWAWQQVENLRNQLGGVPGDVASRALHDTRLTRRHVMKGLLLLLGAGGGWQLWQSETGEGLRADYRTAKGTVSRQQLEDGSLLTLNTQSAADVRFDAHQRTVRLWYGEIAITTAKDALQRPFRVLTRQGQLTALGTEFTVRQQDNFTQLDVQQHAVEVLLASAPAQKRIVNAGESLQFSASEFGAVKPLDDESTSWTKDILSFSDKRLHALRDAVGASLVEAGAAVVTHPDCVSSSMLWGLATAADLVVANTIVEVRAVRALNGGPVPVLWWLHDAFVGYGYISHLIPRQLESNVRVCAVGSHATAAMQAHRPDFAIGQLIYGLPDYAQDPFEPYDIGYAGGLPLYVSVGAFEMRKGQDILVEAIRLLPDEVRAKAAFLFVGKGADKRLLAEVRQLAEEYPRNVFYVPRLTRGEIKSLMDQCACTVCSSRDDPMPTFITEGLIFGKPGIVSEHTGTAGLITEGVDGFVYRGDSPAALAEALAKMIGHPGLAARMAPACRALYERYYSKAAFAASLKAQVNALLEQCAGPDGGL